MDCRPDEFSVTAVTVIMGPAAVDVRRVVGPTAWCVLEQLAATPADDGEQWIVHSSVRDVAARLGVAPNTAQRAIAVLRNAGVVTAIQGRTCGGRFGAGVTTLHAASAAATAKYYSEYLTAAPVEVPGVWRGRQADDLGLSGDVTVEQLEALLSGHDPMVRSFQRSKMLQVAAALELADRVADGPRSVRDLARECDADPGMLLRLCRALAAFGVFSVDSATPGPRICSTPASRCMS